MIEPSTEWMLLRDKLSRLRDAGRRAQFWLRDDDAVEPTPALDRLLASCEASSIPLVLAVIPETTGIALADRLDAAGDVSVAVHGWSHRNYAGPDEKKQELGAHRPAEIVLAELANGLAKLKRLHGERTIHMLVPPWNRIDPDVVAGLREIGFTAISTFGPPDNAPIHTVNSNIDLIDWHGTGRSLDHSLLIDMIVAQLNSSEPVGIMGHHLVHDENAWLFLERLFAVSNALGIEWLSGEQLVKDQ